jgi:hypothetical protein
MVNTEWNKVGKYKTKSFGEVDFSNIAEWMGVRVKHNNQSMNLHFYGNSINEEKINICLNVINNYFDINKTVKKTMSSDFPDNKTLYGYFQTCYMNFSRYESVRIFGNCKFKMIDIGNVIKKLKHPDLTFTMEENDLTICLCYHFETSCLFGQANALMVYMDEQLNIVKFEHCEPLLD